MKFYAIFLLLIGVTLHLGVAAPLEEDTGEAPVEGDANESPAEGEQVGDATTLAPSEEDSNDDLLELPNEHNETIKGYVFEAVDPDEEETEGSGDENHPPQILVLIEDDSNYEGKNDFNAVMEASESQGLEEEQSVIEVDTADNQFILVPYVEESNDANNTKNETNDFGNGSFSSVKFSPADGEESQAESVDSEGAEDEYKTPVHLLEGDAETKESESEGTSPENPESVGQEEDTTDLKEEEK